MQDYSISKSSRRCAISGRSLEPGESYISVILPDGDNVKRIDVAAGEWKGPAEETIGWWKCRMPAAGPKKLRPAPNGVLMDTLSELLERQGKEALAYLLALLLVRRRVLTDEETLDSPSSDEPQTHWNLVCPADGRLWSVPVIVPNHGSLDALQDELNGLLFTEE